MTASDLKEYRGLNIYIFSHNNDPFTITDMIRATITVNEPNELE